MNIAVSIIDYEIASLAQRELFAFTKTKLVKVYEKLNDMAEVLGSTIISTCNRTEIYLNLSEDSIINPFDILCDFFCINFKEYENAHKTLYNEEAVLHLFEVSCGMKSQIWGEDQIISQVKNSIITARENKASDALLEVLFRTAVSCAKKVKSTIDFKTDNNSTAKCAVNIILENPHIKNVLVIGNGEIGRLTAKLLVEKCINTTMTLRQYKYGQTVIPNGVKVVDFSDRYKLIGEMDAVISATSSPHFTLEFDKVESTLTLPSVFIDLAVPRDIDPKIEEKLSVKCYDIDSLDNSHIDYHKNIHRKNAQLIFQKYLSDFYKWHEYKTKLA